MKGDKEVIAHLNRVLGNELVAINQYFLHARIMHDKGLKKLGDIEYHESIDEMKHADTLIQRILFLEGFPNVQDLGKLQIGESIDEMLKADLAAEHNAHADLKAGISHCEKVQDYVSRDLFRQIMHDEEHHIDWLETQIGLIEQLGLQNYLQSQIDPDTQD